MITTEESIAPTPDLTATCWRDDMFLQSHQLATQNAVLYFSASPFYQPGCLNDVARQGSLTLQDLIGPGIEYIIQDSQQPHLFVILKRHRTATGKITPLACYYILDGTVYQAPSIHAVMTSRLQRCLFSLKGAFSALEKDLNPLAQKSDVEEGESALEKAIKEAKTKGATVVTSSSSAPSKRQQQQAERERVQKLEMNLRSVLNQYPMVIPVASLQQQMEKKGAIARPTTAPASPAPPVSGGGTISAQASR